MAYTINEQIERVKKEIRDYIKYTDFDNTDEETKWRRIDMYLDVYSYLKKQQLKQN